MPGTGGGGMLASGITVFAPRPDWQTPQVRRLGCFWPGFLVLALLGLLPAIASVSTLLSLERECDRDPDNCQPLAGVVLVPYLFIYAALVLLPLLLLSLSNAMDPPEGMSSRWFWLTAAAILVAGVVGLVVVTAGT